LTRWTLNKRAVRKHHAASDRDIGVFAGGVDGCAGGGADRSTAYHDTGIPAGSVDGCAGGGADRSTVYCDIGVLAGGVDGDALIPRCADLGGILDFHAARCVDGYAACRGGFHLAAADRDTGGSAVSVDGYAATVGGTDRAAADRDLDE